MFAGILRSSISRWQGLQPRDSMRAIAYGCFYKLRVLSVGVLIIRALLFWVYIMAPHVLEAPKLGSRVFDILSPASGLRSQSQRRVLKFRRASPSQTGFS